MRFERRFEVPKQPIETLRLIADFRHLMSWDDSVESVTPLDELFAQGARYAVRVRFSGNLIDMEYTVSAYEPGVRAVLTGVAAKATAIDLIEVSATDSGCVVDYTAEIQLAFPYSLFDPLLAMQFRKTVDHAVDGLKRFLAA